jgi:hypothetical protein
MKPEETVRGEGPGEFYKTDSQEQTHEFGRGRRKNKRGGKRKSHRRGRR